MLGFPLSKRSSLISSALLQFKHWIEFIQARAAEKGVTVCTTDMFDDAFNGEKAKHTPIVFKDAGHFMFADISPVDRRSDDAAHWDKLQWLLPQADKAPRPIHHTKIYGSGYYIFGTGGPEDGVEPHMAGNNTVQPLKR